MAVIWQNAQLPAQESTEVSMQTCADLQMQFYRFVKDFRKYFLYMVALFI